MSAPAGLHLGLFGGSFNPPHMGHLIVAETMREALGLDAVVWMPAFVSPFKQGVEMPTAEHRLAMVQRAIESHPFFRVSTLELDRGGVSYTVDTLRRLHDEQPTTRWTLLIGGDSLEGLPGWKEPEALFGLADVAVYHRPGASLEAVPERWRDRVQFVEAPLLHLSSTDIRARCRAGHSIRYLVPETVQAYIEANRLYR